MSRLTLESLARAAKDKASDLARSKESGEEARFALCRSISRSRLRRARLCLRSNVKARLHRRFLTRQLDAIFVALELQLQNRMCKPGAIILSAICRRGIPGVSNMFET